MSRLGAQQLDLLVFLARPTSAMVCADRLSESLRRRGLVRNLADDGMVQITPAGLRAIADAWDAGRIEPDPMKGLPSP